MKTCIKILLLVLVIQFSQNTIAEEYPDYAKRIRQEVWAWDKPEFKDYNVPEQYKDESAVILAHHEDIKVESKKIIQLVRVRYTNTDRRMVKINDKVSLDEYSDLSFKEEIKMQTRFTWGAKNKVTTVVGVRIIKPDGTIKEVDVDESVSVTEGKKEKESHKKLAIPDLQIGDIIDYFISEYAELDEMNIPAQYFLFYGSHPTLSYSVHCDISLKHMTVEYIPLNGAKDFTISYNDEKDVSLDIAEKNLPKIERSRWSSVLRDLPMTRMNILNNGTRDHLIYKPSSARKAGLYKIGTTLNKNLILADADHIGTYPEKLPYGDNIRKDVKKVIEAHVKKNPDISNDQLAVYIRDMLYFMWPSNDRYFNSRLFLSMFKNYLKDFKIPTESILMTNKYSARMNEILSASDLDYAIKVNDRYYTYPFGLRIAGEIYPDNQGQEANIFERTALEKGKIKDQPVVDAFFKLPETTAGQNKSLMNINVSFSEDNPLELLISREATTSGSLKESTQSILVTYEDWDKTMRKHLSIEDTKEQEMQKSKQSRKYIEEMNSNFEKRRKDQVDSMKVEIYNYHGFNPKDVIEYNVTSIGAIPENPDLKYNVKYTVEGLVKKAGNNIILDAGKLIGSQWEPTPEERNRKINAYLPTARIYENEIQVQLPAGYETQGLETLNKSVDNEYGLFSASASMEGNTLKINVRKEYKKSFIPVAEWGKLMEMLDKTNEFGAQSVVLKKI